MKIKNVMKKLLVILLIFLTINSIIMPNIAYGVDLAEMAGNALQGLGTAFVGVLAYPVQIVVYFLGNAINLLTAGVAYIDGAEDGTDTTVITPFDILFNKVKLVDVNVFDLSEPDTITGKIRTGIATWYYVLRIIATAILLVILIYVGIRMALTTIASDKAMYNKMLIDWITSLALIFLLQYIILFTFYVNTAIVNAMAGVTESTDGISDAIQTIASSSLTFGAQGIGSVAVFFILVTQTIGLLISYINRMLKLSFLIIISPLITLTYSIDKMGDGKAQALGTWLKEFVFTILMQPFHCIIYMIMVSTALELLVGNTWELGYAILAILCIKFIQDAEKLVRKIFHFEDDNSGTSVAAGMATSALLLSQSKNIGKNLKTGVTGIKNLKTNAGNLLSHAKTDAMVMGAIMSGNNTKQVKVTQVNEETGKEEETTETQKMSMAELREEAMAKQIDKQASKMAKKVYKDEKAKEAYSSTTKSSELNKEDRARYETLKNSGMSHSRAMATLRKEKVEQEKKRQKDAKHPTYTRAKGRIGNTFKAIGQMETFKDLQAAAKTYASVGLGTATAVGLWGNGSNLVTSISSGAAAYGASKEFMKNSTKTLVNTAVQSVMALGGDNKENAERILREVANTNPEDFDKDSKALKGILDNIKAQLRALGMDESSATHYSNNIQSQIKSNAAKGNPKSIQSILTDTINSYNESPESANNQIDINQKAAEFKGLQSGVLDFSDFENKRIVFEGIQTAAQSTGMSTETYIAETVREVKRLEGLQMVAEGFDGARSGNVSEENANQAQQTEDVSGIEIDPEAMEKLMEDHFEYALAESLAQHDEMASEIESRVSEEVIEEMEKEAKLLIEQKIKEIEKIYEIENEHLRNEKLVELETTLTEEYNKNMLDGRDYISKFKKSRTKEEDKKDLAKDYAKTEFQRAALQSAMHYLEEKNGN